MATLTTRVARSATTARRTSNSVGRTERGSLLLDPPPRSPSRAMCEETLACIVAGNVRLEAARVGVSQADLAQILGMSRSAVSLRYTGKVAWRVDELERVAWYLNFPVTDLLEKPKKARRIRVF